jgi:hypothetical protein
MHEFVPSPSSYFTVLRDPVERAISYYYHVRRDHNHHWHDFVVSDDLGLKAFLESGKDIGMSDFQTRVLAGGPWHDAPYGKCPPEAVEAAKHHLREYFSVVGLLKRFDETLLMLRQAFGWRNLFYVPRNITRQRPKKADLLPSTLRAIAEANRRDIALYDHVCASFERETWEQGPLFGLKAQIFRWLNARIGARRDVHQVASS